MVPYCWAICCINRIILMYCLLPPITGFRNMPVSNDLLTIINGICTSRPIASIENIDTTCYRFRYVILYLSWPCSCIVRICLKKYFISSHWKVPPQLYSNIEESWHECDSEQSKIDCSTKIHLKSNTCVNILFRWKHDSHSEAFCILKLILYARMDFKNKNAIMFDFKFRLTNCDADIYKLRWQNWLYRIK